MSELIEISKNPGGYSTREVAKLLELTEERVRAFVRQGFVAPRRNEQGHFRFDFQDLILLRSAKELLGQLPARKVGHALKKLRQHFPSSRSLTELQFVVQGGEVVVCNEGACWEAESGQSRFFFDVAQFAAEVSPLSPKEKRPTSQDGPQLSAQDWYHLGCEVEESPREARGCYRRALELDPYLADARLRLGRLLQKDGELAGAEAQFRILMHLEPRAAEAAFSLAMVLHQAGRFGEAIAAYEAAIDADPKMAKAYYHLAHLFEFLGEYGPALQHLRTYRRLEKSS